MTTIGVERIKARLAAIRRRMRTLGPVMRGSVTLMGKRHKQPYFSVSIKGRTRVIDLGNEKAAIARAYAANYRKLSGLVDEMTLLHMRLLKGPATVKVRQPKRPRDQARATRHGRSQTACSDPARC